MKTNLRFKKFLKPLALTVILIFLISNPVFASRTFFTPKYLVIYLALHVLPLTAFVLSYLWGKKHLAARIIAYVLCFTAALIGILSIIIHLLIEEEGLFPLLTLIWSSAGVTYMTINRTENNQHLTTPKQ